MDNYLTVDLLEKSVVDDMVSQFSSCTWKSGADGGGHKYKLNAEMSREGPYTELDNIIGEALVSNIDLSTFTLSSGATNTIFSKTGIGGQYPLHTDHAALGHYSVTTFLSDPDEYEGGELQLYMNGIVNNFKLEKGKSIIYYSGTPHAVSKVTKGERRVAVNWLLSNYLDSDIREIVRYLKMTMNYYDDFGEDTSERAYEEVRNHPQCLGKTAIAAIERKFHMNHSQGRGG